MTSAFVYDAVRTPFGRFGGALAERPPRRPGRHRDRGRAATVAAPGPGARSTRWSRQRQRRRRGQPQRRPDGRRCWPGCRSRCPATTVNRLCGSSLDAAMIGSRTIETGDADDRARRRRRVDDPGALGAAQAGPRVPGRRRRRAVSTTLGWRLVNPAMPAEWTVSLGEANEQLQEKYGDLPRAAGRVRGAVAPSSPTRPGTTGSTTTWSSPVPGADLTRDESIRPGTHGGEAGRAQAVVPPRRHDHRRQRLAAERRRVRRAARLRGGGADASVPSRWPGSPGAAAYALEPQCFGYAPVEAANRALARAGIGWSDVGAVELNEAFAVQSLACVDAWGIDPEIVNSRGGAIAIGHPLGASGGRILGTLAKVLAGAGERWGVAAICIGVGQGLAVVLEN